MKRFQNVLKFIKEKIALFSVERKDVFILYNFKQPIVKIKKTKKNCSFWKYASEFIFFICITKEPLIWSR